MFNNFFHDKKVLITGNTGFKGSWLCLWLKMLGAHIIGIAKDIPTNPSLYEILKLQDDIDHNNIDIRDFKKLNELVSSKKPDIVFHLAAQALVNKSYQDPIETYTTNSMGTLNLLEVIRNYDEKCILVCITSDKCYENKEWEWGYRENDQLGGKDPYSSSKAAAELIIYSFYNSYFSKSGNIKLVSARAGNVIGGGDWAENRLVPDCFKAWSKNTAVEIRSPHATRPWQHVLEPLSGYLNLAWKLSDINTMNGNSYNFGPVSSQNITVSNMIDELSKYWEIKLPNFYSCDSENNFHEAGLLKLNCDKALVDLKWVPATNFNQTIRLTSDWYNSFYNKKTNMIEFTKSQINAYCNTAKKNNLQWAIS